MATTSTPFLAPPSPTPAVIAVDLDHEDDAPSREALLKRAAELGPRLTFATLRHAIDPILGAKMQPRVVERRARFRKVVKVALGGCLALCLVGAVASIFSSPSVAATSSPSARTVVTTPVEGLEIAERTKAPSHVVAAVRPAPAPKFKKRR